MVSLTKKNSKPKNNMKKVLLQPKMKLIFKFKKSFSSKCFIEGTCLSKPTKDVLKTNIEAVGFDLPPFHGVVKAVNVNKDKKSFCIKTLLTTGTHKKNV